MLRLFRPKPPENPADETKVDTIRFPFLSRIWFALWPFAGRHFFEGIVTLAAKMASSDGAVNETELKLYTRLLDTHFSLSRRQKVAARRFLFKAQSDKQSFSECLNVFYKRFKRNRVLLENAFDVLLSMAYADNVVSLKEQELLAESAAVFQLDQRTLDRLTARHHNWKTQFERMQPGAQDRAQQSQRADARGQQKTKAKEERFEQKSSTHNQQQQEKQYKQHTQGQDGKFSEFVKAFKESWNEVLGVSSTATRTQVKKAYRDLVRAYHPDALPSDLPPEMMRASVERFIEIQKAYETYIRMSGKK